MFSKRFVRILFSLGLTIAAFVVYLLFATSVSYMFPDEFSAVVTAAPLGLMVFSILDFLFVLITDSDCNSNANAVFKNILYGVLSILEMIVGLFVVLMALITFCDAKDVTANWSILATGFAGTAIINCTAKTAVFKHLYNNDLPKFVFPFVHIGCTVIGYLIGMAIGCLAYLAPLWCGIGSAIVLIVLIVLFFKFGYFNAEFSVTSRYDAKGQLRATSKHKIKKSANVVPVTSFSKRLTNAKQSRNKSLANIIDSALRKKLAKCEKSYETYSPIKGVNVTADLIWDDIGYNVMLRFVFCYRLPLSAQTRLVNDKAYTDKVKRSMDNFRNAYWSTLKETLKECFTYMELVIQKEHPSYSDDYSADADFMENIAFEK